MTSRSPLLLQAFVYLTIVLGTMYWSGKGRETTIYDRYLVNVDTVELSSSNVSRSIAFYQQALNFQLSVSPENAPAEFQLPDQRTLRIQLRESVGSPGVLELRVRNGFPKLFNHLRQQFARFAKETPNALGSSSISEISTTPKGREFFLVDPEGNKIVFFSPRRSSLGRPHK